MPIDSTSTPNETRLRSKQGKGQPDGSGVASVHANGNGKGRKVGRAVREAVRVASGKPSIAEAGWLEDLRDALLAAEEGDFSIRLPTRGSKALKGEISQAFNAMAAMNQKLVREIVRLERVVGREGQMTERASLGEAQGDWAIGIRSINSLIGDLVQPTTEVARVLLAVADGDLTQKMALELDGQPVKGEFLRIGTTVNSMLDQLSSFADEVTRVAKEVGTEGKLGGQAEVRGVSGTWKDLTDNVNLLANNLTSQVRNIAEVTTSVAKGDLSKKITVDAKGEVFELKSTVNTMVDQLRSFAGEVTRVAKEVGTDGKLGGQAEVQGVSGVWKDLTDNVNFMASNLTTQVRGIVKVVTAVANGDLNQKLVGVEAKGEIAALADTLNNMTQTLNIFAQQVTSVARTVGVEGKLGAQAEVPGVAGTWKDLTDNVNLLANNLTSQVRNIAKVTTAVANGDLSQKISVDVKGEMLELKNTMNTMVDQLRAFAGEVTRVAREVGTEGKLGGKADVKDVSGTWKDLTDNVNVLAGNLSDQVRNIAKVTTAVANGDLSQKITVDAKGEVNELKNTINTMVEQLNSFASEVTRVAKEVGTEGKLGGQAQVPGVSGTWKDLTDNVNFMARNLTTQVRGIVRVVTAVADGDLRQKLVVEAKGEVAALADTINSMTDTLSTFAEQVSTVAREVGVEGKLGGQARVPGVAGTWKDLTDNVNFMASNLTTQVRGIVKVVTAVANGDLTQKLVGVEAKGEIAALADTINSMTVTLDTFADQVTTVAREVGIEGMLGGQAKVPGAMGTWRQLTDNVNELAGTLTSQLRAISDVATAVTKGDLSRSITVGAEGEVAALKDNINQMIFNLRETTQKNQEQDWLKTNLAKFSGMMQGQKNLESVSRLIMSELTPLVGGHQGAFFMMDVEKGEPILKLTSSYAYRERKTVANNFRLGESLVGQCALEKKTILLTRVPADYIQIASGLGEAPPLNIIVLPVIFEGAVKAVIELASFSPFSAIHQIFLDQLTESIGVVLNMIMANVRTEELLQQSQSLTQELQSQSQELTAQQAELKRSNSELEKQAIELEDKARLLEEQNRKVEEKNREVEQARAAIEEKAEQLAIASKYKSEFLANMSHELRTPLNSLLILAKLLSDNKEENLSDKQVEYARTIHASGNDLLSLINEILDLSKVEAGKMQVEAREVPFDELKDFVERSFTTLAEQKGLSFAVELDPALPDTFRSDAQRLQQVLKNLISNALKFTDTGSVTLRVTPAPGDLHFDNEMLRSASQVYAFSVADTGIGIPESKHRLIFEAFQQADGTTSRKYGGTGLGLSISREIARLLGGEIRIESMPGQGSTFTFYLPAAYTGPEEALNPEPLVESLLEAQPPILPSPPLQELEDDREEIRPGDRTLLIIEDDLKFARIMLTLARERGFKAVVATRGDTGLQLAQTLMPQAITLDIQLPVVDGWSVLDRLKRNPSTRHIPVHVISVNDRHNHGATVGAFAYLEKPVSKDALEGAFTHISSFINRKLKRLLVAENDPVQVETVRELIADGSDVEMVVAPSAEAALRELEEGSFDCLVLDLVLPDADGFQVLETIKRNDRFRDLPVIVYTNKDLTSREEQRLKRHAHSIILKSSSHSPDRLVNETALFLHRVYENLPERARRSVQIAQGKEEALRGKRVLVIDDDMRNVFALTSVLESQEMKVEYAENGKAGIETLQNDPAFDMVLLDVMMPEMDGYETAKAIRADPRFRSIPVITLTAKALKEDREKCIAAGASDYLPKPVEPEALVAMIRRWLRR